MADLDDFFAKKDRKKSKTSSSSSKKFASTAEELVKQIEETKKNEPRPAARKESAAGLTEGAGPEALNADGSEQVAVVEDEWKEFEAEERKDYTGLKIGQMQLEDDNASTVDDQANGDKYDSDGELNADGERQRSGPWKKVDGEGSAEAAPAAAAVAPHQPLAGGLKSVYISPAMRDAQAQMQRSKMRKGVLPDIHDQEYFPVLGSAKPEEVKKKRPEPGFTEVQHGGRGYQRPTEIATSVPVSIGNRFNSLADS